MELKTKLDILAFGAHPDDVELSCSGTLMKHGTLGYTYGIIDLTSGELGTRGSAQIRMKEAECSREIMGAAVRKNLHLPDGLFEENYDSLMAIVKMIRKYQPKIIFANALADRHPDHGRAAELVARAAFLSGLRKIKTELNDREQIAHRPARVFHYIQDRYREPNLVCDISPFMDKKLSCISAFASQFYDPQSGEPETPISSKTFLDSVIAKNQVLGRSIQVEYAEGFEVSHPLGVNNLIELM